MHHNKPNITYFLVADSYVRKSMLTIKDFNMSNLSLEANLPSACWSTFFGNRFSNS